MSTILQILNAQTRAVLGTIWQDKNTGDKDVDPSALLFEGGGAECFRPSQHPARPP